MCLDNILRIRKTEEAPNDEIAFEPEHCCHFERDENKIPQPETLKKILRYVKIKTQKIGKVECPKRKQQIHTYKKESTLECCWPQKQGHIKTFFITLLTRSTSSLDILDPLGRQIPLLKRFSEVPFSTTILF